jgi:hypothetical protein
MAIIAKTAFPGDIGSDNKPWFQEPIERRHGKNL